MEGKLLCLVNLDTMSEKKQREFLKNMSEGYNQDIYMPPDKNNLIKFKKSYIKSLSKKEKLKERDVIIYLLLDIVCNVENYYFYIDCDCKEYKNNSYYECYSFSEKTITELHDEGVVNKDVLFNMKKQANKNDKNNIVCFGNGWHVCCCFKDKE